MGLKVTIFNIKHLNIKLKPSVFNNNNNLTALKRNVQKYNCSNAISEYLFKNIYAWCNIRNMEMKISLNTNNFNFCPRLF